MTRHADNPQLIGVGGAVARLEGKTLEDNPYPAESGAWHLWRYGWQTRCRRKLKAKRSRISRETVAAKGDRPPRDGATWTDGERQALELATGWLPDEQIAVMLERSQRSIITERARQKARAA
jgi:hypothetical protein